MMIRIIITLLIISMSNLTYAQGKVSRNAHASSNVKNSTTNKSNISNVSGQINGHDYVDLGLPSGLKWATCNVGASKPYEYGDYFAWGITSSKKNWDKNNQIFNKYTSELISIGVINLSGNLTKEFDAASVNWGDRWRMPTEEEFKELIDKCIWEWTIISGKKGCMITGPNKKSIFIPAGGYRDPDMIHFGSIGKTGCYWSSTYESGAANGLYLSNDNDYIGFEYQLVGQSIRPVIK